MGSPQSTQRFTEYFFLNHRFRRFVQILMNELLAISSVLLCVLRGAMS